MTTRFSRNLTALLVVALVATPVRALADPSAADIETARGLYVEGLQLRDAGKLEVSLARFKAAHSLAATPITSLELGRAHALVSELVEARDVLGSVERMPVLPTESTKAANARLEARALSEQIRDRMPALRVVFAREPSSTPRVTIDGQPIAPDSLTVPRKMNPGNHTVVAETVDGARANASIILAERDLKIVTLTFGDVRAEPPPRADRSGPAPWFYVGLGTAGVGLLAGTITGVVALSKAGSLESQCTGSECPRTAEGDLATSRTMGTISTVAFVVAGAGVALALVSWFARPSAGTQVRALPNALRWSW